MDAIKEGMLASAKAAEAAARVGERLFGQNTSSVMNFKSQICTDRSQSERLMKLGLKKETADMVYAAVFCGNEITVYPDPIVISNRANASKYDIPAWSLHRLIELAYGNWNENIVPVYLGNSYDMLIGRIEFQVKQGKFNKEYLV